MSAISFPGGGGGTATSSAVDVDYDNTESSLTATDVQAAIDELTARIVALETP
jgi:hypothetical protein